MARIAQALRACRVLRTLPSASAPIVQQAASLSTAISCQPSTSGRDSDGCSALASLGYRFPTRFFCSTPNSARIREVSDAINKNPPGSLQYDRGEEVIPADLDNPVGRAMLRLMGFESKKSKLLHGGQRMYGAITEHVDTGVLHRAFDTGSTDKFWSTYVLLSLHVWLVIHRLRAAESPETSADVRFFRQRFYNQFQQDVEYRVYAAGLQIGVSKWLKRLEEHWYETAFELDQVLEGKSGDKLSDVMLRKYYGGEERHRSNAELLAAYTAREIQCLALTDAGAVMRGHVRFSSHLEAALVRAGVVTPTEAAGQEAAPAGQEPKQEAAAGKGSAAAAAMAAALGAEAGLGAVAAAADDAGSSSAAAGKAKP